jgi:hypothetical protein
VNAIRLSAAVMAHPTRAAWASDLAGKLGLAADRIVWDRCNSIWDTARRAWLAFDPEATHHLVIQDDAIACRDLITGTEESLAAAPAESVVSLYLGTRRPMVHQVTRAAKHAAESDASWIVLDSLCWGVAVVLPTSVIPDMVAAGDIDQARGDDLRIRHYAMRTLHWQVWHPWPSLVDHRDTDSLIGHGNGRKAHRFIGEDVSALGMDWSKGQVTPGDRRSNAGRSPATGAAASSQPNRAPFVATNRQAQVLRVPRKAGSGYDEPPRRSGH